MDHIGSVLPKVLSRRGLVEHAHAALIVYNAQQWLKVRAPCLTGVTVVQKFQNGTLLIACGHSLALQECRGLSQELVYFLQQERRFADVRTVRLVRAER